MCTGTTEILTFYTDVTATKFYHTGVTRLTEEELVERVGALFQEADVDNNGVLDRKEFKVVFVGLQSELGLTDKDVLKIMAEADGNDDGTIDYKEFLPIAIDVMNSIYAKQDFEAEKERREDAIEDVKDYLLHGMPQEELEAELRNVFNQADEDQNGWLSRKEFTAVLKNAELGFTRKEINVMLTEVDEDGDGKVTYEEFVPMCFQLLVQLVADDISTVPQEEEELKAYFLDLFTSAADDDNMLGHSEIINLVVEADLGLTRVQIHAIMSESEEDENGNINVIQLSSAMAGMVLSLVNVQMQQDRAAKLSNLREQDGYELVWGFSASDLKAALNAAFSSVDTTGSGTLARDDIKMVVCETLPSLPPKHVQAIMSIPEPNPEGMCPYDVVAQRAFQLVQFLQNQDQM